MNNKPAKSIDLFALGIAMLKSAKPVNRSIGFLNVNAVADIARINLTENKKAEMKRG